jgi:hypothetical protein
MYILHLLVVKALPHGIEFLTVTGKGLQFLCLLPGAGDHTLHKKEKGQISNSTQPLSENALRSYHGQVIRLLEDIDIVIRQ